MNRSMLLVICDFLLLSLLALARFDAPVSEESAPIEEEGEVLSPEAELVEILKMSLQSEREVQEALQSELEAAQSSIAEKEEVIDDTTQTLADTQRELRREQKSNAELSEQRELLQQEKGDMAHDIIRMREENILERERLRQAQERIEEQRAALAETQATVQQIEEEKARIQEQKQMVETELRVAETRNALVAQQLENSKLEIEFERQQREEAEKRAESLSEGVQLLAGTSVEIKEEIQQLQPKTPNALFTEYKRNRVKVRFDTNFPGIFQNRTKTWDTETILITDGQQTYAILHTRDTPFDLSDITPKYETVDVSITIGDSIFVPEKFMFMRIDPRIMIIPVDEAAVDSESIKVYPIVLEPFRFPKAVVIDSNENYFGESSFKVHSKYSNALQMDQKIISQLFGEFSPSRGDLVIAQTGEFMGVMINNEYAGLIDHISHTDTIWIGEGFDGERSNTIVTKLSTFIYRNR